MKTIMNLFIGLFMLGLFSGAHAAKTEWPSEIEIREANLELVGHGQRRKLMMSLYDIALYTPTGVAGDDIITVNEPKALRIVITSSLVSTALFTEAVLDGYKKFEQYDEIKEVVRHYLDQFEGVELVEGDVYTVFNDPIEGLVTYHNDEVLTIVNDRVFTNGMFNIWLGEKPVNRRLKNKLLGS